VQNREPMRRGSQVSPRPVPAAALPRPVIGVGPGARPAGLSPIQPRVAGRPGVPPDADVRRPVGPGVGSAPRPVPADQPRPMHPPISRVLPPAGRSAATLQAMAAAGRSSVEAPGAAPVRPGGSTTAPRPGVPSRVGFGMPNLRRNVCPHFYMTGSRGAIPIQAPHLLKALVRQEANVSRCQLRGGVHMEQGYVNDVCLSARFNQCVFYEDELGR
jgi:hypothetical protein